MMSFLTRSTSDHGGTNEAADDVWSKMARYIPIAICHKQVAIKIIRKQKEIFMGQDLYQKFEKGYDPTKEKGLVDFSVRMERFMVTL